MGLRDTVPACRMDPSPLHGLVAELAGTERFRAFVDAFPTPARVSEPALPLVLAALHETLARPLLCLLPEDEQARDAVEAVGWYIDAGKVALLPSRGVRADSGLEPPAHLVGERARSLAVLAAGGFVCASARALVEGMPPEHARPAPVRIAVGDEVGLDRLVEALALAGYERAERVEERGQLAVRGGLVDIFPSTGHEPFRVEFFGDEIEHVRAFSPFTQRTLRPVSEAMVYAAAERRRDFVQPEAEEPQDDLVPPVGRPPDLVWQPDDVRGVWAEEGLQAPLLDGAELDPFPRAQAHAFEAQRPAIAARGLAEAETELAAMLRQDRRVIVAFPHRGEALRTQRLLRKVEAELAEDGAALPHGASLGFVVSPARRGFVWRDLGLALLPDVQVFRKRPPRADARLGRALAEDLDIREKS